MSEAEAAQLLGMSVEALAKRRRKGTDPMPHGQRKGDRKPARYAYQAVYDWGVRAGRFEPS